MSPTLMLREVISEDECFLLRVYDSTRRSEFDHLGWSAAELDAFIRMQFEAQSRHYRSWYPEATFSVILVDGDPVGRLVVDRSPAVIVIVELAVLPRFQRAGVGTGVVRPLLDEAQAAGLPVRCRVELSNTARFFWEHLGFVAREIDGAHLVMECDARPV